MKKTINSTGRIRISRKMVSFDIIRTPSGLPESFSANLAGLNELAMPTDADVIVEAYFRASGCRFEFGTIGAITTPPSTSLAEIDKGGEILFRVKVVDKVGRVGRLLASGDRIPANTPIDQGDAPGRKPLLPVKPEWLGELIWDVSLADSDRPYLLVNNRIPDLALRIKNDPLLRGSIFVDAFRRILSAMLDEEATGLEWLDSWSVFLSETLGMPFPGNFPDDDDKETYIRNAIKAFSDKYQFAMHALTTADIPELPHD